jgi:hypothetical protein
MPWGPVVLIVLIAWFEVRSAAPKRRRDNSLRSAVQQSDRLSRVKHRNKVC